MDIDGLLVWVLDITVSVSRATALHGESLSQPNPWAKTLLLRQPAYVAIIIFKPHTFGQHALFGYIKNACVHLTSKNNIKNHITFHFLALNPTSRVAAWQRAIFYCTNFLHVIYTHRAFGQGHRGWNPTGLTFIQQSPLHRKKPSHQTQTWKGRLELQCVSGGGKRQVSNPR